MSENNDKNANRKTTKSFAGSFSSLQNKPENDFELVLARLKAVFSVETDTDLAKKLDLKQGSISAAKQKRSVPPVWITAVALNHGISADWLLTGEGEMKRDGMRFAGPAATRKLLAGETDEPPATDDRQGIRDNVERFLRADLVEPSHKTPSIGDLLAKTAKVLESDTVYRDALHSNIEAFYHGVTLEQKISNMEVSINSRLDALEAENRQLRKELEQTRAGSTLSDTG